MSPHAAAAVAEAATTATEAATTATEATAKAVASNNGSGTLQAIGLTIVTSVLLFFYALYFNEELQKVMPTGKANYFQDGEELKFEFDSPNQKYNESLANEFQRFKLILFKYVWDIEFGPGGSGDLRVKWKRD